MTFIALAVEGPTDRAAAEKILSTRSLQADPLSTFVKHGKSRLDKKMHSFNQAARFRPWLVLRDADHDCGDCPVSVRRSLLPLESQNLALCLRLPVRCLEAWLLADLDGFSTAFHVSKSIVPDNVEELFDPKQALINVCRKSRQRDIRRAMVPREGTVARVGPEYTTLIVDYCMSTWEPDAAAENAPSLARALADIDRLIANGVW